MKRLDDDFKRVEYKIELLTSSLDELKALPPHPCTTKILLHVEEQLAQPVSYTHLTLPTKRIV